MSNPVLSFFKKIGHAFAGLFHLIDKLLPEAVLKAAVAYVEEATTKFIDNPNRRTWVIAHLQQEFHLPEHLAALATELAVTQLKHVEEVAFAKVDAEITPDSVPTNQGTGPGETSGLPADQPPSDESTPAAMAGDQPQPPILPE